MKVSIEDTALSNFEIHDNVLTVNVELYWEKHAEFLRYVEEILSHDCERVILDLTPVTFIFSAYMGTIGHMVAESAKAGKRLTVRVSRNLSWLFEIAGFEKLVDLEIVN